MSVERLIVIGASSGGIEALSTVAASLPEGLRASVCAVVHTAAESPGVLAAMINKVGPLAAVHPVDGGRLEPGTIYVAPPDHHLMIEPGVLRLSRGPKENRFRPAIDPLFRSAARVYGPRVIGVVLSGNLDDGTAGLGTIKQLGGIAVVQDPSDAPFPSMPASALAHVKVDHCLRAHGIGPLLARLVDLSVHASPGAVARALEIEVMIAQGLDSIQAGIETLGAPSRFACPDCHGVLRELMDGPRLRYRCHTGHAYSAQSLMAASDDGIENGLWSAIRALEEAGMFLRHAAATEANHTVAANLAAQAAEAAAQTTILRDMVTSRRRLTRSATSSDPRSGE